MPDQRSQRTFEGFCHLDLPKSEWTHQAHLVVCWVALSTRHPAGTVDFLRGAISRYNLATGGENTSTGGYHETLTRYFVGAVASLDAATIDEVLRAPRCGTGAPLRHWSRDALFSRTARSRWVEPDLAPLPWLTPSILHRPQAEYATVLAH